MVVSIGVNTLDAPITRHMPGIPCVQIQSFNLAVYEQMVVSTGVDVPQLKDAISAAVMPSFTGQHLLCGHRDQ